MTSKIEKKFFDTFEIKPKYWEHRGGDGYDYPQITDHILLEMICYLSRYRLSLIPEYACFKTIEKLKENILRCAMGFITPNTKPMLYIEDIRSLFKEKN